jgi:hypothetical protein
VGGTIYAASPPFPHLSKVDRALTRSLLYLSRQRGLDWAVTWQTRTVHKPSQGIRPLNLRPQPGKWRSHSIS